MGFDTSHIETETPFHCAAAPSSRTSFAKTENRVLRAAASRGMVLKTVWARHSGSVTITLMVAAKVEAAMVCRTCDFMPNFFLAHA
jgi:hypothetical protein